MQIILINMHFCTVPTIHPGISNFAVFFTRHFLVKMSENNFCFVLKMIDSPSFFGHTLLEMHEHVLQNGGPPALKHLRYTCIVSAYHCSRGWQQLPS